MNRNSKRAPDLATLDLTDTNALLEVIHLKPRASVPKKNRDRIILALKPYPRDKLSNKYVALAPELDEFGKKTNTDTSNLTPQVIRERIADIIVRMSKPKLTDKMKTKKTNVQVTPQHKVSPSPPKKPKKTALYNFPNAKKQLSDEIGTKR